jgi:glycosyltransferase involved in cell wall biosynthesis
VVWSYWPHGYSLARELRLPGLWVFDADHNIVDDVNETAGKREEVKALLADISKDAELAVAGSRAMLEYFSRNEIAHCAHLRNGVDMSRFTDIQACEKRKSAARRPRIGYLGSISKWMEGGLLMKLIGQHPEWQFILGGPRYGADPFPGIEKHANVECLGEIASKDVPRLLATFDIGLALYRCEPWLDGDSMKVFEYLAAGVPVVSTPFHPYLQHDFAGLLQIASNAEQFAEAIRLVHHWDETIFHEWDLRRTAFLRDNSWSRRGQEALALVRTAFARRSLAK